MAGHRHTADERAACAAPFLLPYHNLLYFAYNVENSPLDAFRWLGRRRYAILSSIRLIFLDGRPRRHLTLAPRRAAPTRRHIMYRRRRRRRTRRHDYFADKSGYSRRRATPRRLYLFIFAMMG